MKTLLTSLFAASALMLKAAAPDSVYIFTYAIPADPHKGIHIAYSTDARQWQAIGQDQSFVSSDFGAWGSQKNMYHPSVIQDGDTWYAVWQLGNNINQFATTLTQKLSVWKPQDYPFMNTSSVIEPVLSKQGDKFVVVFKTKEGQIYQTESSDFKHWSEAHAVSNYKSNETTATIDGIERQGCITRAPWNIVENLINKGDATTLRNRQYAEVMRDDATRFHNLQSVEAKLTLRNDESKNISPDLIGIFFEDISYAADGGLYAELIQNRDFEYSNLDRREWNAKTAWALSGEGTTWTIETSDPIHENNTHYTRLNTEIVGASLQNEGFDGIYLKKGEKYDLSLFMRKGNGAGKVEIKLTDGDKTLASTILTASTQWKQLKAVLSPSADCKNARLTLRPLQTGTVDIDFVSLFPQNTFKGRKNGLRPDLAQALADMQPKFVRFPGGCVSHGQGLDNMYRWIYTVGPLWERKSLPNIWNYHQSMGLGFYEYFQFCEDIGAEPLPVLPAGVPCQNSGYLGYGQQGGLPFAGEDFKVTHNNPLPTMEEYLQELLNLIEWANGDPKTSKWAKMRADAGHPKPFNLKYLGVGNEDLISDVFAERFTFLNKGIKEKYPEIQVVGTVGPFFEGSDYEYGWELARKENVDIVDEHYYVNPGWYIHNQDYYDKYDRNGTKVYLGEWASKNNRLENALAEALHITNLERNADVVIMSSYAPLFCKEGHSNWNPDLIYFNNEGITTLTPSYYVQKLAGNNSGSQYIPGTLTVKGNRDVQLRVGSSVVKTDKGDLIIKLVNMLPSTVKIDIDLGQIGINTGKNGDYKPMADLTTLSGNPSDRTAEPMTSQIEVKSDFAHELPAYSFTIIRLHADSAKK